jgi:hypothetical protein
MRISLTGFGVAILWAAQVGAIPFSDTFDPGGVSGSVWTKWTGANDNVFNTSNSHNHTLGGSLSARVDAADPAAFNGYADFGTTPVPSGQYLRADVYLFEDFSNNGTNAAQPVTNMLCLIGDTGGAVGFGTDYLQVGVVPFWPGGSQTYGFRTRYNDQIGGAGIIDSGISRKAGWTKLSIEADPYSTGGAVRFYVDDALIGSSFRAGGNGGTFGLSQTNLRWVRLGNNSKTYENFWYDDVSVNLVPEPASVLMLGLGGLLLGGVSSRRRRPMVA